MPSTAFTCITCGTAHSTGFAGDRCPTCHACGTCCQCNGIPVAAPHSSAPTFHGEATALLPRYVSLEIEVAGMKGGAPRLVKTLTKWGAGVVRDGSVHANSGCGNAFEINTAPARGEEFAKQLGQTTRVLTSGRAEINDSCGVHCHVDARGATAHQLAAISILWSKVEVTMFNAVAPGRLAKDPERTEGPGYYCKPLTARLARHGVLTITSATPASAAGDTLDMAVFGCTGSAAQSEKRSNYSQARYRALNLHSWFRRGTIEFRLHQGTIERQSLMFWALICAAIVEYGMTHTPEDVSGMRGTPAEILGKVIGHLPNAKAWISERRTAFLALRSEIRNGTAKAGRWANRGEAPVALDAAVVTPAAESATEE